MTEHELQNQIRAALSEYGKVFRTNAGEFWQGKRVWSRELQAPVISDARASVWFFRFVVPGFTGGGIHRGKTKTGRVSDRQKKFLEVMRQDGHRAGVARSVEDAIKIIKGEL